MRRVVVAVVLGLTWAAGTTVHGAVVDRIELVGEGAAVRLQLSGPVTAGAHSLVAGGARIYLDLPGTALPVSVPRTTPGRGGNLLAVRAAQFDPDTTRIVLDLTQSVPFTLVHDERTITIELQAPVPTPPESTAQALPPPAPRPTPRRPSPAAKPRRPALGHPLIVIDAGHGGHDPGAEGFGGVIEKDVVLEFAHVLATRLAARLPVDVVLTRNDDSFVPLRRRLALPGEGATLFISLHANACDDPSARGLEVFYGGGPLRSASSGGEDPRAALLGRTLHGALAARVGGVRGEARPGSFQVLLGNPVPSSLIEIGYLTHPDEAARARDPGYRSLVADALVDGVATFLRASAPPL